MTHPRAPLEQEALRLQGEGLKYREIAAALDIKISRIPTLLYWARRREAIEIYRDQVAYGVNE
jgi:DNA-directed RNA polymerase specialized sigma24 family protein